MFSKVLVGIKEGINHELLTDLTLAVVSGPSEICLATLIRVGTNEDEGQRIHAAQDRLDEAASPLRDAGHLVKTEVGVIVVAAAQDLLKMAREFDSDLIVIGLAKQSRVGKAIMGSDAQRVLLGAHCPVLATRLYD